MMNTVSPLYGDLEQDLETAKRLIGAHPDVDLRLLMIIATDRRQPESSRVAALYTLGFTDDDGVSHIALTCIAADPNEPFSVRDYASEALEHMAPTLRTAARQDTQCRSR